MKITERQFMEFADDKGSIDVNNMSKDLQSALKNAGVTAEQLKDAAGPDGKIEGKEFKKLFQFVDTFDANPSKQSFDYSIKTPDGEKTTKAGELYDAFSMEVDRNRLTAHYSQPGAKLKHPLLVSSEANAVVVPKKDQKPVDLAVDHVSQFDLYPGDHEKGNKACAEAAKAQCDRYNKKTHGTQPHLNGADKGIQVGFAEDEHGRLAVNPDNAKKGREYIDRMLDSGYPVYVGISFQKWDINYDKLTDHAVTITGRGYDKDGRLYYSFKDPGSKTVTEGKFYVDQETGKIFRPGDMNAKWALARKDYEVTFVGTYKELPP
jgi:hypothetical protein